MATQKEQKGTEDRRVQKESQGRMVIPDHQDLGEVLATEVLQDIQGGQDGRVKLVTGAHLVHLEI